LPVTRSLAVEIRYAGAITLNALRFSVFSPTNRRNTMDYQELDDYAHFADNTQTIEHLFLANDNFAFLNEIKDATVRAEIRSTIISSIQALMPELQADEKNEPEGGFKIIVRKHHIQLRKALLRIAKNVVPIAAKAALIGVGADIGIKAGVAVAENIYATTKLIQKLDESELDTCEAISRVIARKESFTLTIHKASLDEVEKIFEHDLELEKPANVEATVKNLVEKKVLEVETIGSTPYYEIVF
jgi:hypothetical protein